MKKLVLSVLLALTTFLVGCASTTPPTKVESALYQVQTNYVPFLVPVTNVVWQTNTQVAMTFQTNIQGVLVPQYYTNVVTTPLYQTVLVTNIHEEYVYYPSALTTNTTTLAGTIGNTISPGVGTLASTIITGLVGLWGYVRSSRSTKTAINSMQAIETIREVIKALPNGAAVDASLVSWLQAHQSEAGVTTQVVSLLANEISNPNAKEAAGKITAIVSALQNQTTTPGTFQPPQPSKV